MGSYAKLFILCLVIAAFVHILPVASYTFEQVRNLLTPDVLESTFQTCGVEVGRRNDLENTLAARGQIVSANNRRTDTNLMRYKLYDPIVRFRENSSIPFTIATDILATRFNFCQQDIEQHLPRIFMNSPTSRGDQERCILATPIPNCDFTWRYRTANGVCNNLQNPTWGMAMSCQQRMLPSNYVGSSGYRQSVLSGPLPPPRTLSLNLHFNFDRPSTYITNLYMAFGQLIAHDVVLTPFSTTVNNEAIECCPNQGETHPQCAPVLLQANDPFYSRFNVTCLNFVRSVVCPTCTLGPRQQMDQITSFIDASFVYGNSEEETRGLRTNDGTGLMRTQLGDLLPASTQPQNDQCSFPETNEICFEVGDSRGNQHTLLTSLHTIFHREHNRLARGLRQVNPQWNGDRVFQEARRILGAQMQAIVYGQYLPVTLGPERMRYFRLWLSRYGGRTQYNNRKNPSMMIEFTTAAFRFGHSLVNSLVSLYPLNGTNGPRLLCNEFFQPFDLYNGIVGPLLEGASFASAQYFDRHLVTDVTNCLYRVRGNPTGLDLAAFNINRGRDHGLPTYVDMVRYCSDGFFNIRSFRDLTDFGLMAPPQAEDLRRNYRSVQDIDLWSGILMEFPNDGAVVGPTATCILGTQFKKLKYGDRYYFEHGNEAGSFTTQQLEEIKRATALSTIICQNSNARRIAVNPMLFPSRTNPVVECRFVRGINLMLWRE